MSAAYNRGDYVWYVGTLVEPCVCVVVESNEERTYVKPVGWPDHLIASTKNFVPCDKEGRLT